MRRRGWGLALKRILTAYGSSGYGYKVALDALWIGWGEHEKGGLGRKLWLRRQRNLDLNGGPHHHRLCRFRCTLVIRVSAAIIPLETASPHTSEMSHSYFLSPCRVDVPDRKYTTSSTPYSTNAPLLQPSAQRNVRMRITARDYKYDTNMV